MNHDCGMPDAARVALGSTIGALLGALCARAIRGLFSVPAGGVGFVTVNAYPKGWDYAVVAFLVLGALLGGITRTTEHGTMNGSRSVFRVPRSAFLTVTVFLLMLFVHDHPYLIMETFHEGEHLTPAFVLKDGGRPYRDIFFLHGFATDGGLDALVLGDPPSPRRERRMQTVLDAATLALLVPIAAEVCATTAGVALAVLAALSACAAGWLPVFPYYRIAPVLLAALGLLQFARTRRTRSLFLAFAASTLGILWSFETGMYALAGTVIAMLVLRPPWKRTAILAAIAIALPLLVLVAARADIRQFFVDSFVIIPHAIDAIWALPAPSAFTMEAARYYFAPVFYGFLLALGIHAWRRGDRALAARMIVIATLAVFLFRTAAGRVSWSHTRFALPLLGIAIVAFLLEPLVLAKRRVAAIVLAIPLIFLLEIGPNLYHGAKLLAGWRARQRHDGLVAYPLATGKGIYTTQQNHDELAALNGMLEPGETFLDFSGERALYYLLQRRPPLRCPDIHMLSAPPLFNEAMAQLEAHPPAFVVLEGTKQLSEFDGVPNRVRVPELAAWIDARYPNRVNVGHFVIATRR